MTDAAGAPTAAPAYRRLLPGDRFPTLHQACGDMPSVGFNTRAGRYQLFGFFLTADDPAIRAAIAAVTARRDLFDDQKASFVGVSVARRDRDAYGLASAEPGVHFAWDYDRTMSEACGATPLNDARNAPAVVARKWVLVDPSLHVLHIWPMRETPVEEVIAAVEALPPPDRFGGVSRPAPILLLPNVLEPELCRRLVELHELDGGHEIGFFRGGKQIQDPSFKRRRDVSITDPALRRTLVERLGRRVVPEIERLFFMRANFVERHLIGCYSAADGGHFKPHVDNLPPTAHRRFAVSINLSEGFEGGETVFPEYNTQGYKAPPGWAVIFPCAILHAVREVTAGVRYAYLPFLFDQTGEDIRDAATKAAST
jgi:predicted 2-oxoglutarate/Fe(II)-dependent dioxygenase YbiX